MAITVGDIYTKFPSFKPEDMEKLVGSANYNGRTTISLTDIAAYRGTFAQELSVFVAGREKENYTKLLANNERTEINEQIGIKDNKNQSIQTKGVIPMGISVFDIARSEMA